jgi:hypothetical protein
MPSRAPGEALEPPSGTRCDLKLNPIFNRLAALFHREREVRRADLYLAWMLHR